MSVKPKQQKQVVVVVVVVVVVCVCVCVCVCASWMDGWMDVSVCLCDAICCVAQARAKCGLFFPKADMLSSWLACLSTRDGQGQETFEENQPLEEREEFEDCSSQEGWVV